ncbi:MAG: hypothetical protein FWD37_04210 [Methanomassiliicoccaceae archaeon]|nr:hypothetical protein [Methanomassiliicoccaceae archaeon]
MIKDKKAMTAVFDAFIFITIIGIIAAGMFIHSNFEDNNNTIAKDVHDTFFGIRLGTDDLFKDTDTQRAEMCDLMAACMMTSEKNALRFAEETLRSIVPPYCGYELTMEYKGKILTIGDGGQNLSSKYSSEIKIIDGNVMRTTLSLY